jgi:polyisoprenoid-binding protein YceI
MLRRWWPSLVGVALALVGLLALGIASQGLSIHVAPPAAPSTEVDPLALLREDQAALAEDVRGLRGDLETVARALDAASGERDAAARGALDQAVARLERRLGALEARPIAGVAPTSTTSAPAPEPEPEPVVEAPAPAAAPRGRFSFRAQGLDLDERQRFEVIAALSRVGFDAKSTLHDFTGVTSDVSGWVEARLAEPARDGRAAIVARAETLRTGVDGRDEEMRKRLDAAQHPELRFDLTGFEVERVQREPPRVTGAALGTLTVRGVARPVRVPMTLEVDASRRLVVTGEVRVKMSDHGIEPPDLGVIVVQDEVRVWIALRLRAMGRARAP